MLAGVPGTLKSIQWKKHYDDCAIGNSDATREGIGTCQSYGDIFEQFDGVYDSIIRRAFELVESNEQWRGHELDDWLRAEAELLHPVPLEGRVP